MQLGGETTARALRSSTAHALRIAAEQSLHSIAFPAVGTGIAGLPIPDCARIMLREVVEHLKQPTSLEMVYFVLFDAQALSEFEKVRAEMAAAGELLGAPEAGPK
jgi:O-acetyl-ADP-ribose deacetylase (regulator of RNase III)